MKEQAKVPEMEGMTEVIRYPLINESLKTGDEKVVGILTSGGDAPGMNACVASVAKGCLMNGLKPFGILRGYNGILGRGKYRKDEMIELDYHIVREIENQPGTFLKTDRCDDFKKPEVRAEAAKHLRDIGMDVLVVIGGDGTMTGAKLLMDETKFPVICIPGTIDNDLGYTEMTLGFDTAVNDCVQTIRSVRATSRGMGRPAVVEVMGRHCGEIALHAAMATGAELLVIPEVKWSIEKMAARLNQQIALGHNYATMVISENSWSNCVDLEGWQQFLLDHGKTGVTLNEEMNANRLASVLKRKCGGAEVRATVVGYSQRGNAPTARDASFAFNAGQLAVSLILRERYDRAIGMRLGLIYHLPISQALSIPKFINLEAYDSVNKL